MLLMGRLPQTADRCEWGNWIFEIVDLDGKRIDKVIAMPKKMEPDGKEPTAE
jgi:putative hemolysin